MTAIIDDDAHGLRGVLSTIAELHVHRELRAGDPTARHMGGNTAIRDHEVFDNDVWINTKSCWERRDGMTGFSPVNWRKARDPDDPERQLDLVALVQLQATFGHKGPLDLTIHWECAPWWLVPASLLWAASAPNGKSTCSSLVPTATIQPYLLTAPLTSARLHALVAENEILMPS